MCYINTQNNIEKYNKYYIILPYGVVGCTMFSKNKGLGSIPSGATKLILLIMKVSDIKTLDNISAIYCFRNTINNKCYVGQAEQLRKRLLHHINNFKNCRYDAPLYRAMTKYGLDAFEVEILEIIDGLSDRMEIKKKLDEYEIYYIEHLNSYAPNGYNQTRGGDAGVTGYKFTEKQRQHTSENSKRRAADGRFTIYCYDIINKEYITEVNTNALAKRLNINIDTADVRRMTCKKQYILARSKEKLEENIKFFKENPNSSNGKSKKESQLLIQIRQMVEKILALMKY